jgi:Domain of unknown function (DUF4331)
MSNHFTGLSLGPPLGDQRLDLCDLYAFRSPTDPSRTVIILNANPNADALHPDAIYRLNIDNDGDLLTDLALSYVFSETKTTSPGLSAAIFNRPTQAVRPGMPTTPRNAWGGSPKMSSFCKFEAGALNDSRQPNTVETRSPGLSRESLEAMTSPIAPPCSGSPS